MLQLFADLVFRQVYTFTYNNFRLTSVYDITLFNTEYLQHGGGNCCSQNNATVNRCTYNTCCVGFLCSVAGY